MADSHRVVAGRIATLLRERGQIPSELQSVVGDLYAAWEAGIPDDALLTRSKVALWRYLDRGDGGSTAIGDSADRSVRAALCLAEPAGQNDPKDLEEWAHAMLDPR